jgi:preprotein translocase SecE subunit
MSKIIEYIKETKAEARNVNWPTKTKSAYATIAVVLISLGIAYYLGFFDYLFSIGLQWVLLNK